MHYRKKNFYCLRYAKTSGKKAVKLSFTDRTSFLKVNSNELKTNLDSRVFKKSFLIISILLVIIELLN